MVSANTDACMFTIEEEYREQAHKVLRDWEELTGLELEEDKIVKICMRDVNSYCEIVQIGDDDYKVNYKGGEFKGKHKFKWNKETHKFDYSFDDEIEANSLTIVSEALLKKLLFDIPVEETINKCDDIFRYQLISHLGSTYEKCVQESPNGDIELQRNNRIYAGKKPSGIIIKVKYDGRRDSLANCPPNPIVDNANKCTIEDIDKNWYIKIATQKINDFLGVKRLTDYKKTELIEKANKMGLEYDPKIKKADLIKLIEENEERESDKMETKNMNIYEKINCIKKEIREHDFIMDKELPSNLGSAEYASIGQYYSLLHEKTLKYNVFFKWDVMEELAFEKNIFQPTGKLPQHLNSVSCVATFINIDNTEEVVEYMSIASGSDSNDKGISCASTLAFRNWFDKNFTPKYLNQGGEEEISDITEKTEEPKIPTYIPPTKKEELTKEVVKEEQHEESDEDDITRIINKIMKVREIVGNDWGSKTLDNITSGTLTTPELLSIELKVDNKLDNLEGVLG